MLTVEVQTPAHSRLCLLIQFVLFLTELYTKGYISVQCSGNCSTRNSMYLESLIITGKALSDNTGIACIIKIITGTVDTCAASGPHEDVLLSAHRPVCWFSL